MSHSIECWSCKKSFSLDALGDEDGHCPHCHVEIDLAHCLSEAYREIAEQAFQIEQLKEELKGPDGYDTWKDAAIAERVRRVKFQEQVERLETCHHE